MASKPMSSGSKTVEYIGTGPNGATIAGGAIPNKELVFDKVI